MRAYIILAAFAALAMIAIAQTTTEDRVIGAPDCTVDCSGHAEDTDNGIGTSLPAAPKHDDDGDDN